MRKSLTALAFLLIAIPCSAQNTVLGRGFFSAFDVQWEHWKSRNPWMNRLDDADWKTWIQHGVITEVGGYTISKLTPLSFRRGRQVMCGFYVAREIYNKTAEHNPKRLDPVMDALVPCAVAVGRVRFSVRL